MWRSLRCVAARVPVATTACAQGRPAAARRCTGQAHGNSGCSRCYSGHPRRDLGARQALGSTKSQATDRGHPRAPVTSISDVLCADAPLPNAALVILNVPLCEPTIRRLWRACSLRLCADGAASRLYDMQQYSGVASASSDAGAAAKGGLVPDVITGDMDSARPEARAQMDASVRALEARVCVYACACVCVEAWVKPRGPSLVCQAWCIACALTLLRRGCRAQRAGGRVL